jgi:SAM-dependent methyltransferase
VDGESASGPDVASGNHDVVAGILKCSCGNMYPVIEGVPRFLEGGLNAFPQFLESYKAKVNAGSACQRAPSRKSEDDYDYIRKSFSKEWKIFDYASDKTWGWTLEERKRIFLDDVKLTENLLKGKLLLDAGCGNGTLTAALSGLGMDVIGVDLNDGLGAANRNRSRYGGERWENVQFVQGNLFNPPLKPNTFDLIYCSGVLHHTPNTKESFRRLVPLVKDGGRLYVWVYRHRSFPVRLFMESGRQLKRLMPLRSLLVICKIFAPFYKAGAGILNATGVMKFRERSVREITLDLFDCFAPQYNHCHNEEEVQAWFREEGFTNITVSGRQKHGFGVYGDRN